MIAICHTADASLLRDEQVVFIDDRNVFNRAIIAQPHSARARGRLLRVH